jgi:hypothetical protein
MAVNVAVTVVAALVVTAHVPVPVQPPPLHPVNALPSFATAVSVTTVPKLKADAQVAPHVMPAGDDVTVPAPTSVTVSVLVVSVNVAVTVAAAFIVTTHVPVPVHPPPDQPVKLDPAVGAAVSVTAVPALNDCVHVAPQLMPAGADVTVPAPFPARVTVSAKVCSVNVAVTDVAAFTVTTQVPVPVQPPPDQPVNVDPAVAAAVSVTAVPVVYGAEHVAPQLMPAGADVTVPAPVPAGTTVRLNVCNVNVAVTFAAAFIATTHVPVPVHPPPDHPAKVEFAVGAAVSVTDVPALYGSVQSLPQVIPVGDDVTVPVPVPASATVSVNVCRSKRADAVTAVVPAGMLHVVVVPLHAPDQLTKLDVALGAAVSVIAEPAASVAAQVLPQLMPAGDDVMVPVPVPVDDTVTARVEGPGSVESPPEHAGTRPAATMTVMMFASRTRRDARACMIPQR